MQRRGKIRVNCAESFARAGGRENHRSVQEDRTSGVGWTRGVILKTGVVRGLCAVNFCGAGVPRRNQVERILDSSLGLGELVSEISRNLGSQADTRCALSLAGRIASGLAHPIKSRHSRARGKPCWVFGLAKSSYTPLAFREGSPQWAIRTGWRGLDGGVTGLLWLPKVVWN